MRYPHWELTYNKVIMSMVLVVKKIPNFCTTTVEPQNNEFPQKYSVSAHAFLFSICCVIYTFLRCFKSYFYIPFNYLLARKWQLNLAEWCQHFFLTYWYANGRFKTFLLLHWRCTWMCLWLPKLVRWSMWQLLLLTRHLSGGHLMDAFCTWNLPIPWNLHSWRSHLLQLLHRLPERSHLLHEKYRLAWLERTSHESLLSKTKLYRSELKRSMHLNILTQSGCYSGLSNSKDFWQVNIWAPFKSTTFQWCEGKILTQIKRLHFSSYLDSLSYYCHHFPRGILLNNTQQVCAPVQCCHN